MEGGGGLPNGRSVRLERTQKGPKRTYVGHFWPCTFPPHSARRHCTSPDHPKKKREDVRKHCGAASRARPKGERWLGEPFRASCPKLGARSSAPQCVAGSDVAERQRGVATDDVAKRMAQATKTKRGETPAAGWIEGPETSRTHPLPAGGPFWQNSSKWPFLRFLATATT